MKGILLMALGHSNYGKMAYQLAVSIKNISPTIPIALAFTDSAILDVHSRFPFDIFSHTIKVPESMYTREGKVEYIKAKVYMYDLSPFDETIFLDADIIMFPKRPLDELFEEFRDIEFTIQNRGYIDLSEKDIKETSYWCDILEMKRLYGFRTGKYYHIHSEFVFFRKGAKIEKLFNSAKEIYNNLKCSVKTVFAGAIPDELPIAIAMRQNSVYPHKDNYRPIFWPVADKKSDYIDLHNLYDNFFGYSTGGSFHSKTMKANYNRLAKFHSNRAGINQVYFLTDKRKFLPERTNI